VNTEVTIDAQGLQVVAMVTQESTENQPCRGQDGYGLVQGFSGRAGGAALMNESIVRSR
jgi:hypothetical protein